MKSAATSARITLFFTWFEIRSHTGACFCPCASPTDESPRSPWTKPPSQLVYCSRSGRSRCIRWSRVATAFGVAPRPRTTLAASPGSTAVPTKIRTEATNSASSAPRNRRTRNATTGEASRVARRGSATAVIEPVLRREPRVHEEVVAEHSAGVRREPLQLGRHAVDPVRVRPVQVAALVPLDLLDLVPGVLRGRRIGRADRLEQQVVPALVLPVRLVVRRLGGERLEVEELERRDGPLRLGERHLQVEQRRVVVRVGRHLLELDRDARRLGLLREQRSGLHEA